MIKKQGWEVWLALGFISVGLIMIGVAWNGAASVDAPESQIPYLLSGGLGGIALVGLGCALLLFIAGRRMLARLETKYDAMIEALAGGVPTAETPPSSNGKPAPAAVEDGMVVVGRSSFHMPDCRLVVGKDEMEAVPAAEAESRGLAPCRVCEPLTPHETTQARRRR